MTLTHRAGDCKEGPCPHVYDYDPEPEKVAVQGTKLTDPDVLAEITVPDHESVVLVPRELLLAYARAVLQEEAPT